MLKQVWLFWSSLAESKEWSMIYLNQFHKAMAFQLKVRILTGMEYDLLESVSQRGNGTENKENCRTQAISNELRRCCQLYEAKFGNGKDQITTFEIEQRQAEVFAKRKGFWVPMNDVLGLGVPSPSGNISFSCILVATRCLVSFKNNSGSLETMVE